MNRCRRFLFSLLAFGMAFSLDGAKVLAAESEGPYTYQVTFYAGNQGTFADGTGITVTGPDGRAVTDVHVDAGAEAVTVSGLKSGYVVSFDGIQGGAVALKEDSPYYVRGLRRSGYDNDDEKPAAFPVEQDQDYVIAYGIKGDMVSYVIRYQDASGNTLAPSRTYYGNVGDRPVVAFLYVDGYEPRAYNLTKTLTANEAENVFTFVYAPVRSAQGGGSGGGGTGGAGAGTGGTGAGTAAGTDEAGTGAAAGAGTAGTGAGAAAGAGTDGAGTGIGAGGAADVPTADGADGAGTDNVASPDGEVPAGDQPELVEDQDDDVALAEKPDLTGMAEDGFMYGLPVLASVSLILAAALAGAAEYRRRKMRRRAQGEEKDTK